MPPPDLERRNRRLGTLLLAVFLVLLAFSVLYIAVLYQPRATAPAETGSSGPIS